MVRKSKRLGWGVLWNMDGDSPGLLGEWAYPTRREAAAALDRAAADIRKEAREAAREKGLVKTAAIMGEDWVAKDWKKLRTVVGDYELRVTPIGLDDCVPKRKEGKK